MKKIISLIVSCVLVLTAGITTAFAAEPQDLPISPAPAEFSDVTGTPYEEAVEYLTAKDVINGFEDGTFRPEGIVTRAQACKIIAKMLDASDEELKAAAEAAAAKFTDVKADNWAAPYIGYCVEKGIAAGYPNGIFKGSKQITLAEYATFLCRADGDSDKILGGTWPENYMSSAKEKGFFENLVNCDPAADAQKLFTRGNTAIMTYSCMTAQDAENPGNPDEGDKEDPENPLENFSGRAFGIILETGTTLNKYDEVVGSITFLMGSGIHEVLTTPDMKDKVAQYGDKEALVYLQMSGGAVKNIVEIDRDFAAYDKEKCVITCAPIKNADGTITPLFSKVERRYENLIRYYTGDGDNDEHFLAMEDKCIVYTCKPDGGELSYEAGSLDDVYEGCYIIAYTVDDEAEGAANVIIVIDGSDADQLLGEPADDKDKTYDPRPFK